MAQHRAATTSLSVISTCSPSPRARAAGARRPAGRARPSARDAVPGRQHMGHRVGRALGPGHVGKADGGVHGVVHRRAAVRSPSSVTMMRSGRRAGQRLVIHPAAHAQVGQEQPRILARRADDLGDDLAPARAFMSTATERLPLFSPAQNRLRPSLRHRPAARVEPALQPVEADHVRAHLRQRHAGQRRRHEGRALDHAHALENPIMSHSTSACIPR
jgi:hypothetical protein